MASRKMFISYRRDDSRADAGRLYDRLHARYPNRVFRDVGSLEPGVEWREAIGKVLGSSDACIVVIGPHWLDVTGANGKRRLDDPRDVEHVTEEWCTSDRVVLSKIDDSSIRFVAQDPISLLSIVGTLGRTR
jgi:hypothetical protein